MLRPFHQLRFAETRGVLARARRPALLALLAGVLAAAVGCAGGNSGPPRAVIIDQLAANSPNPEFVQAATKMLEDAGYAVDYAGSDEVTVDFYRSLPRRGYSFLVLRNHSARRYGYDVESETAGLVSVDLFTSERYDPNKHVADQQTRRLDRAYYVEGETENFYFGVTAAFVESSMKGRFKDATVLLMGCDGLTNDRLARAFESRGAEAVVGWDGLVTAQQTDTATERLLQRLLSGGLSVEDAVAQTMADVGVDPTYGSRLTSFH